MNENINRLAYLNSLNKKPQDILIELIQRESYKYNFDDLSSITNSGEIINKIIFDKYKIEVNDAIFNRFINNNFKILDKKLVIKNISSTADLEKLVKSISESEKKFLENVSSVREKFIEFAKRKYNKKITKEDSKEVFNQYIYSVATEKDIDTSSQNYFIFKQFLCVCFEKDLESLKIVEDFGIANGIQHLVINDFENNPKFLDGCTIFIDTPILMRWLGYDGIAFYNDYKIIFQLIRDAGAVLKIFEHTFDELWGILFNFKKCIAQNILDAKGVDVFLKARQEFKNNQQLDCDEILTLDKEKVRKNIENTIEIIDSVLDSSLEEEEYQTWAFDGEKFKKILYDEASSMQAYQARIDKDIQSISAINRLRRKDNIEKPMSLKDGKYFLLVDNYALIKAIREYHTVGNKRESYNELLLENTLLFSLWQNLSKNNEINRSLFRSKCFAMNTIDDQFKDKLYRAARRLEAYSYENSKEALIANPSIVEDVYEASIKDEKCFDEQYIASTVKNKIENERKELKTQIKNRELLIKQQQNEIDNKNTEIIQVKNINIEEIQNTKDKVKQQDIEKLAKKLSKKIGNKVLVLLKGLVCKLMRKSFNAKNYFLTKAKELLS